MAESGSLDPPHEVKPADPDEQQQHHQDDYSDSDDQFTDAQSAPMTPHLSSPLRKMAAAKDAEEAHDDESQDAEHEAEVAKESKNSLDSAPETVVAESATHGESQKEEAELNTEAEEDDDETGEDNADNDNGDDDDFGDDFGDDFDDFAEGEEADEGFDDFDNSFAQATPQAQQPTGTSTPTTSQKPPPFPIPDFDGLSPDEVVSTTEDLLSALYPPETTTTPTLPPLPKDASIFINPRSASLWSQLVAPPPLSPPDWIRSRTRRLFLVSLGVPVDLDEILPKSKQKKLVLPSLHLSANSPRTSSDSRSASASRLKQGDGNTSSTSVDTQGKPSASASSKKRKGAPPEPDMDLVAARYLCNTTDEALDGMTDEELKEHVSKLEAMQGTANDVLEYWKKRTDEKIGDREAFEGVIENLVKHARKVRK